MKAVVLAAGKGTRLHPLTLTRPKHLVPVGGTPIIDHVTAALKAAGIVEVVFVVHYMADSLRGHLGDGSKFGMCFEYVVQEQLKGTADATSCAEPFVEDSFFLTYGDWITNPESIRTVLEAHEKENPAATMAVVPVDHPEHYGVVVLKDSTVQDIREKPPREAAPSNLANAGMYVLSKDIFRAIRRTHPSPRGELEITDSLSMLLKGGSRIVAAKLPESDMIDVGLLWDLFDANRWILERMEPKRGGIIEDGAQLTGPVYVGDGTRIRSGTYLEGPTFIGENSDIGPNCFIRAHTSIGSNVRVGNGCEIKNSIVMMGAHIGHLSYVGDSIIGSRCNFGAGTTVANYRFDGGPVKMQVKEQVMDTGRRKLGVVLGDDVKTGINALLMPGVKAGPGCWIGPGVTLFRDIPADTMVTLDQNLIQHRVPH